MVINSLLNLLRRVCIIEKLLSSTPCSETYFSLSENDLMRESRMRYSKQLFCSHVSLFYELPYQLCPKR